MAIVFISPKKRQGAFLRMIILAFVICMGIIFFIVFFAQPQSSKNVSVEFNKPKVTVDTKVFDSEQFRDLQPFSQMQVQFQYSGFDKKRKSVKGFIAAVSLDEARKILEATGITIVQIKEAEIGRDNPFVPYYELPPKTTTQTTSTNSAQKSPATPTTPQSSSSSGSGNIQTNTTTK